MAFYTINIELGNDAFSGNEGAELARILRKLANELDGEEQAHDTLLLKDLNGNSIGWAGRE